MICENICYRYNYFFYKKHDKFLIVNFHLCKRLLIPLGVQKIPGKRAIDNAVLKVEVPFE